MLEPQGSHPPAVQKCDGIIKRAGCILVECTDQHCRAAILRGGRHTLKLCCCQHSQRRLLDQIFCWIANQLHLWKDDEVSTLRRRLGPTRQHGVGISSQIADALVHLGQSNVKTCAHCASLLSARRFRNLPAPKQVQFPTRRQSGQLRCFSCRLGRNKALSANGLGL